jgi:hypothetical protein
MNKQMRGVANKRINMRGLFSQFIVAKIAFFSNLEWLCVPGKLKNTICAPTKFVPINNLRYFYIRISIFECVFRYIEKT